MHAYLIRTPKCIEYLNNIISDDHTFQDYYLFESEDAFQGKIDGDKFVFQDTRLPLFAIPLYFVLVK